MMWKNRKDLPLVIKTNIKVNLNKLRDAYNEIKDREWNVCISGELEGLREQYGGRLSMVAYNKTNKEIDTGGKQWQNLPYHQMGLSSFNNNYTIRNNRNSNTRWDNHFLNNDRKLDERAYNILDTTLPEYIKTVVSMFGSNTTRVGLAKLLPHEEIKEHRDYDPTFSCRYHIAIQTHPDCTFTGIHIPDDGYAYFVNTGKKHWVKNNSNLERVHLIINVDDQDILNEALKYDNTNS